MSGNIVLGKDFFNILASILVFKNNGNVVVLNGYTKEKIYEGADHKTALSNALANCPDGGLIFIKEGVDLPLANLNPSKRVILEQGIELEGKGYSPSITDPVALTFNLKKVYDIASKLKPQQLLYENEFNGRLFNYQTIFSTAGPPSLSISNGKLTYEAPGATVIAILDYKVKYPSIVLITKVNSLDDTGKIRLGIADLSYNNYIQALYYHTTASDSGRQNTVVFWVKKDGGEDTEVDSAPLTLTFPAYLMLVIIGSNMALFHSTDGENWELILKADISTYHQMQNESYLDLFYPILGVDNGTGVFDYYKIYHFLPLGISNLNPVTYEDGNPIIIGNKLYFTGTIGNIGSGSFESLNAIFTFDLSTYDIELVSVVYDREYLDSITGYAIMIDHASHIMYDRRAKKFRAIFSAWDDAITRNRVCLKVGETTKNLLKPGIYVVDIISDTFSLNASIGIHYDPFAWYDYSVGKYYIEVSKEPGFVPVLIETIDFSSFSIVTISSTEGSEGGSLFKVGGNFYIIGGRHQIYDLNLNYLGTLSISEDLGTNPWGFIVPKYEKGKSKYVYMVFKHDDNMFDISWSYGRVYVYESNETEDGYPYFFTTKIGCS